MGAGNQLIRDLYGKSVTTYYIDPCPEFDEVKADIVGQRLEEIREKFKGLSKKDKARLLKVMLVRDELPVTVKEDEVYSTMGDWENDELLNLTFEVGSVEGFKPVRPWRRDESLAGGWRDAAMVIAESDHCMVAIADNESSTAIGCVPTDTYDSMEEHAEESKDVEDYVDEAEADLVQTRKRADAEYEITENDIRRRAEEMMREHVKAEAGKSFAQFTENYRKDANAAMRKVHEYFGESSIRVRSGPWTSGRMPKYEEMTEEQRNNYY